MGNEWWTIKRWRYGTLFWEQMIRDGIATWYIWEIWHTEGILGGCVAGYDGRVRWGIDARQKDNRTISLGLPIEKDMLYIYIFVFVSCESGSQLSLQQGLVNVPIEHRPPIGDTISNRYLFWWCETNHQKGTFTHSTVSRLDSCPEGFQVAGHPGWSQKATAYLLSWSEQPQQKWCPRPVFPHVYRAPIPHVSSNCTHPHAGRGTF